MIRVLAVVLLGSQLACGGCPVIPRDVTIEGAPSCLVLSPTGRCVDGVGLTGTNGCTEALVLTPPKAQASQATFAAGATVTFEADIALGADDGTVVTWTIPARLGTQDVTLTIKAPRNRGLASL